MYRTRFEFEAVNGYDFERLVPGSMLTGPAIIWSSITTVVIGARQQARMDQFRNLIVSRIE